MIRLLVTGMAVGVRLMLFNCWKAGVSIASIWNTFVRWCWDVSVLRPWSTLHRLMWESRPDADSSSAPAPWWESEANLHPPAQIGKDWFRLWVLSRRRLGAEPSPAGCLFRPRIPGLATDFRPEYSPPDYGVFGCDFPYWVNTLVWGWEGCGGSSGGGGQSGRVTSGLPTPPSDASDNRCPPACLPRYTSRPNLVLTLLYRWQVTLYCQDKADGKL